MRNMIKRWKWKLFLLNNRTKNTIFFALKLNYIRKMIVQITELIIRYMPKLKMPKIWPRKNKNSGNKMYKGTKNRLQNGRSS